MICQKEKDRLEREEELEENGGSEKISPKPNNYKDKYQKEQTFAVMKVLGYTYNEVTGIWTKPGVKEVIDGKIVFPKIESKKVRRDRIKLSTETIRKIIEYKNKGWTSIEIEAKLNISDTTVYNHYKKWKDTLK
jgi:DNA-binding NarL/FixJ family response regulator